MTKTNDYKYIHYHVVKKNISSFKDKKRNLINNRKTIINPTLNNFSILLFSLSAIFIILL